MQSHLMETVPQKCQRQVLRVAARGSSVSKKRGARPRQASRCICRATPGDDCREVRLSTGLALQSVRPLSGRQRPEQDLRAPNHLSPEFPMVSALAPAASGLQGSGAGRGAGLGERTGPCLSLGPGSRGPGSSP